MSQHNHFLFVYLPSAASGLRQCGLIGNVVFFHLISNELNAGTFSFSRRHGTSCCSCVQPSGPPGSATPSPITSWKTMRWQQRSLRNSGKHNRLDAATVSHFSYPNQEMTFSCQFCCRPVVQLAWISVWISVISAPRSEVTLSDSIVNARTREGSHLGLWHSYRTCIC